MKPKNILTDKQRLEFTKQIEFLYEASLASKRKVLAFSFLKGIVTGLGIFVGGTIVVAVLLWVLSGLGQVPFLDNLTDSVKQTLEQGKD